MKLTQKIKEMLKKDLDAVRDEVIASFSEDDMKKFKSFDAFFDEVDVQNSYEKEWKPAKWKPYFKQVWDEYKSNKLKLD